MSIITDESIDAYHAHQAISKSKAMVFRDQGPEAYNRYFNTKDLVKKTTDAHEFGQAFECLVEHDRSIFDQCYAIKPRGMSFATKEGKAWKAALGKRIGPDEDDILMPTILDSEDWEVMKEMQAAIQANTFAREAMSRGKQQVTIRREVTSLGVMLQSRPDRLDLTPNACALVDLKTTRHLDAFRRDCVPFGYHYQIALGHWLLAQEGHTEVDALLVVVEKKRAPRCRVMRIPEEILAAGWAILESTIRDIAECYKTGMWVDAQGMIEEVVVPQWQVRELESEMEDVA